MDTVGTLFGQYVSPWTEKARWALDHHRVPYRYREHVALLGELSLRAHAGKWGGPVSVPLWKAEGEAISDSLHIALFADRSAGGPPLFPAEHADEIIQWNARSEAALFAARTLYLERLSRHREAKVELQPAFMPLAIRRASVGAVGLAVAFLRRKYGIDGAAEASAEETLTRELEALRAELAGRDHLLASGFTYADVAMAVTLQFVSPVADRFLKLGPGTRETCEYPALAARFGDLVAWRDALYERHRPT